MADHTHIEWTDATWNPIIGCSVVSAGCKHCYAMRLAGTRLKHDPSRVGLTVDTNAGPVWNGQVRFNEKWLDQPLRWKRGRRIFVCAHGDLFHEAVPDEWLDKVFTIMALASQHTFQVLTKRPNRMLDYATNRLPQVLAELEPWIRNGGIATRAWHAACREWRERREFPTAPLANVWHGVSVEDQATADERIPVLLATPAAVRWISAEPLLGPMDLTTRDFLREHRDQDGFVPFGLGGLNWVVVGGESGAGARPMHPGWARALRDQCAAVGVAFLFKQWGAWLPGSNDPHPDMKEPNSSRARTIAHHQDGRWGPDKRRNTDTNYVSWEPNGGAHYGPVHCRWTVSAWAQRLGKKAAGRELDGREWNEYPEVTTP